MTNVRSSVFYFPYEGRDYKRGYRDGTKLLILGESFYNQVEDPNGPTFVIGSHVCKKPLRFFTAAEQMVAGKKLDGEERWKFWTRVAFTNLIQKSLDGPGDKPTDKEWQTARKAFVEIIKWTKPDLVFVFSRRAFSEMADSDEFPESRYIDPIDARDSPKGPSKYEAYLYKVEYKPGNRCLLAGRFNHPRHPVFPYEKWHKWAEALFKLAPKFK
jgi:hypothetical protein